MGGNAFLVSFDGRHQMNATLVGRDPLHDIAVLKVDKPSGDLTPIKVGSLDRVQVGQTAIAIGNPFGLDHTLTRGTVSALGRQVQGIGGVTIRNMIQTDAAINPGNSGGPLLDSDGQLIGMNTMIYSQSGSSAGIGFAVPVSFIKRIVPQIIEYGRVIRPGMGVSVLTTGQKYYLIGEADGVVINAVERGSPAARAGLRGMRRGPDGYRIGDIIVGIDDIPVKDFDDQFNALDRYKVGDRVKVRFLRDGRERAVRLKLISIQP
jgi:S1-C subfamily serine protease